MNSGKNEFEAPVREAIRAAMQNSPGITAEVLIDREAELFRAWQFREVELMIEGILRREPRLTQRQVFRRVKQMMRAQLGGAEFDITFAHRVCTKSHR